MAALVLVISAVIYLICTSIVVLRVRRRRAATARWQTHEWALQRADLELEAIRPRRPQYFRTAVLPLLVGVVIWGVIVLSTLAYQYPPALLLGLGVAVLVVARLRRAGPALEADDAGEDRPSA